MNLADVVSYNEDKDILTCIDTRGIKVDIHILFQFQIPNIDGEYIAYSMEDYDDNNEDCDIIIGKIDSSSEEMHLLEMTDSEKKLVEDIFFKIVSELEKGD